MLIDVINPTLGNQVMVPVSAVLFCQLDRATLRAVHDADFLAAGRDNVHMLLDIAVGRPMTAAGA